MRLGVQTDPMIWQFIDSSSVGGAERHIETLAGSLARHGTLVRVVMLADHGGNPWQIQLDGAGLDVSVLDGRMLTLLKALRAERPALLHTHGYKAGILGRVAARLARVPVVSTFHSGARGAFPVGLYEVLDDWTSCLGQRIAVSQAVQARLPYTSKVIPSYVLTPPAPASAELPPLVAFVGRLSAEKGPDDFCRLAARASVLDGFAELSWHVWGDGPMRRELEAKYGALVQFHGIATDMGGVWPRVGLLVMPSRFEGVPLAALEAAAYGIPVLASRVGGLPTVIADGKTGWMFTAGDIAGAVRGLTQWQSVRSRETAGQEIAGQKSAAMRAACWAKARSEFSEARWLPDVLAVYRAAGVTLHFRPALSN